MKLMAMLLALSFVPQAFSQEGLRSRQVVLKGVLFRSGGDGGLNSLSDKSVQGLCEEGVAVAYYLYPSVDFSNSGTHHCSNGVLEYKAGYFNSKQVKDILLDVMKAANGENGPVLVHCWNGWHASGEVSAYALRQFCGWNGDQAARYWADSIGDRENLGKYGFILKRIREFVPFVDITIAEEVRASICP